jgi:(p)ppGpp synthase/HD superfamily hydrolase
MKKRSDFPRARMNFRQWKEFCATVHALAGQRYGEHPYSYHLARVEAVLRRFDFVTLCYLFAAWGHDLIEDTPETRRTLAPLITFLALAGIWGVTDEPGSTRKIRKHRTYPKIARFLIAIVVKLADRIANVEENIRTGNIKMFERYKSEHAEMMAVLRKRNNPQVEKMWDHLDWLFTNGPQLMAAFRRGEKVDGIPA